MSLIGSIHTTFGGMQLTEAKIATASANVSNADKTGYTRKEYQATYTTVDGITTPSGGITISTIDKQLYKATIGDISDNSYYSSIATYLESYSSSTGAVDGGNSISATIDDLQTQVAALATSPDDSSQKINLVDSAQTLANTLNNLSSDLQGLRQQADQAITTSVTNANDALTSIDTLNKQILKIQNAGGSTADLEDERMVALQNLASEMDVNYFITDTNQLRVYTGAGQPLVDSGTHLLSYDASNTITDASTYPTNIAGIMVGNKDITENLRGGTLAALVELRDDTLVNEQAKLDALASTLATTVNDVLNTGTSSVLRNSITGAETGVTSGDAFSATGTLRLAVLGSDSNVVNVTDMDLSAYTTVGDFVTALNSLSGVSATITANGQLQITAQDPSNGIGLNQMDSAVGSDAKSVGSYFGLNNLFTGESASNIQVTKDLANNPDYLATATLSGSASLAAGDRGVATGDGTVADNLQAALGGKTKFSAAGNFAVQTVTLASYAAKIISNAATSASSASSASDVAQLTYNQTKSLLENSAGVNIDEETANMTILESQYEAAATMIATIRDMFDTLMTAMR